ncbi:MAG: acyltransferase [Nakamurella sp.]
MTELGGHRADHMPVAFRPDIQGLRAVAVILVVCDHLFTWPGGEVGVDVFFVISGFLITGLLLREHEETGRISWAGFYGRRVRRIIPAATVCLVTAVAVSYLIYRTVWFDAIRTDGIWSFFFVSNWHYAEVWTDRAWAGLPISPLAHFWSLSVEEQFYIVWPVLLIIVLRAAGRRVRGRGWSERRILGAVLALVAAGSFSWAIIETAKIPYWAYFSTFSRAWELCIGALLALTAGWLTRVPAWARPVLLHAGLAAIVASLVLIGPTSAFPGPWAALPVIGAALVVASGIGGQSRYALALTNPVSVYVGKISYSLYLWHLPVIVMLASVISRDTGWYYVLAIEAMVAFSVTSFYLVENPVRRSTWLVPTSHQQGAH